ncbi:MAG: MCP four helix bundle domain-containing protein [Desulfobacterales bacterium]|nr:MCP four helix bundle domain-containing protein [Desulfobacterales bacterium]
MWEKISLRTRVYIILSILFFMTLAGGIFTVWYTFRIDNMLNTVLNTHLASYQVAESLENALINQKGFVSYYFMDGDPEWLRELGEQRQIFRERLKNALTTYKNKSAERNVLEKINSEYNNYIKIKDQVINLYTERDLKAGL